MKLSPSDKGGFQGGWPGWKATGDGSATTIAELRFPQPARQPAPLKL